MEPTTCPSCGHRIEDAGAQSCPNCGANLDAGPPGNSVPFEDTSQPFVQRFLRTAGMAFSDPMGLFSRMDDRDIGMPLLYGVIVGTIAAASSFLWNMMFGGMAMLGGGMAAEEFTVSAGVYVMLMCVSPILAAVGLFISAGIYHLMLMVLGDGERGFAVTFRAVAYGNTPSLLGVVPFCGGIVGGIWAMVLVLIGGKIGHGTEWWKAILAYFLPLIICCCLTIWLMMTLGFIGALAE